MSLKHEKENTFYDLNIDSPAVEKVTVGDAEEYFNDLGLEYNVDYVDVSKEKKKVEENAEIVYDSNKIIEQSIEPGEAVSKGTEINPSKFPGWNIDGWLIDVRTEKNKNSLVKEIFSYAV